MGGYAYPEVLVETDWLAEHLNDDNVAVVEVDVDTLAYDEGHIRGAFGWNWQTQLCDNTERDIISKDALEQLLSGCGISNDTTIVIYGDNNNWFACWAFWQLKIYGHDDVRILNGGRKKWIAEGRETTKEVPTANPTSYTAWEPDFSIRAYLEDIRPRLGTDFGLVDVRSPDEYSGRVLAPPGMAETCQRGGHIPGASNIPWGQNCNEDGTFKSRDELEKLYADAGVDTGKDIVAYCRIGERSSLSWFVLKYLVGAPNVANYDGSWTEWGNLVRAPIVVGEEPG